MHTPSTRFTPNPSMSLPAMRSSGPTPLSAAALPSFDPDTLDPQAARNRLEQIVGFLDNSLRLPDNPRTFFMYLAVLMVIFAGAFMQVLMAAQIMQAQYELNGLEQEYLGLERENGELVFLISTDLNLERLYGEAADQGYVAPETRQFVFIETPVVTPSAATELATTPAIAPATLPAQSPAPQLADQQEPPAAGTVPLQSWGEFWARMWMPATGPNQSLAAQAAPASSVPGVMPEVMPGATSSDTSETPSAMMSRVLSDADEVFATWWQQTTTRTEVMWEQLLGR